jgi:hypothetical protein
MMNFEPKESPTTNNINRVFRFVGFVKFVVNLFFVFAFFAGSAFSEDLRSFDEVLPALPDEARKAAFSPQAYSHYVFDVNELIYRPAEGSDLLANYSPANSSRMNARFQNDFRLALNTKKANHFLENILVIPYKKEADGTDAPITKLTIYNTLQNIHSVAYYKWVENGKETQFLSHGERISQPSPQGRPVPVPPFLRTIPKEDRFFVKVKGPNLGWVYASFSCFETGHGVSTIMVNERPVFFLIFPVLGAKKVSAAAYIEPVKEGILFQTLCVFEFPSFVDSLFNVKAKIDKLLSCVIGWAEQQMNETLAVETRN